MKKILFLVFLLGSCTSKTCLDFVEVHRNDQHHFVVTHKKKVQLGRNGALYGFDFIKNIDTIQIEDSDELCNYITNTTFVSLFEMAEIGDTVCKDFGSLEYELTKKDTFMVFHYFCNNDMVK